MLGLVYPEKPLCASKTLSLGSDPLRAKLLVGVVLLVALCVGAFKEHLKSGSLFEWNGLIIQKGVPLANQNRGSGRDSTTHPANTWPSCLHVGVLRNLVNFHHLGAGQNASVAVMSSLNPHRTIGPWYDLGCVPLGNSGLKARGQLEVKG